jgi:hypothetical protein
VRIIAIMMVYQCGDVVLGALQSVDGLVDEIRCFDSKWERMESKMPPHSIDDTRVIIENFALTSKSKVSYTELSSPTKRDIARETAVATVDNGDWIFVLDSDERVTHCCDVCSVLNQTNQTSFNVFINGKQDTCNHPCRLFKKTPNGWCKKAINSVDINLSHSLGIKKVPHASEYSQHPRP